MMQSCSHRISRTEQITTTYVQYDTSEEQTTDVCVRYECLNVATGDGEDRDSHGDDRIN